MESSLFKYDIFISFADEDVDVARKSANTLRDCGMNVFFSKETLRSKVGQQYVEEIFDAMKSSEHMLLILSEAMLQSKWVKREYQTFFNTIAILSDDKRRILIYNTETSFDINKLPLYLQNYQVASEFDDILVSLGKSPQQNSGSSKNQNKSQQETNTGGNKKSETKSEIDKNVRDTGPKVLETLRNAGLRLYIENEEKNYTGQINCYEEKWIFISEGFSREIDHVVDVRTITLNQTEWIEFIHLAEGVRNYCYFSGENSQKQMKLFKLGLLLKSAASSDPNVISEYNKLESERTTPEIQQKINKSFQKGVLLSTYSDVFYRHWDERSLALGVSKSSNVAGIFNVYSNCFEFVSTEFNFSVFNITNIYFLAQNAEYINNYMRVDYFDINANMNLTYLFYRFSFFGDSPTSKMYNEIANLFHQGKLLFEGN